MPRPGGWLAGVLRTWGTARFRGGAREPRVRFRDAVPVRRDLRRQFRRTARTAMGGRKTEMTAGLRRLSADHVLLSGVIPGVQDAGKIAVSADGTRLLLGVRCCSSGGMERFGAGRFPASRVSCPAFLGQESGGYFTLLPGHS